MTVALVTGGGSGIGRETALRFARDGVQVVVADVDEAGGAETCRLVEGAGGEALFVRCDVSRWDEVEAMVARTLEAFGRLDVAVNNAGVEGEAKTTAQHSQAAWDRVIAVNLTGVFLCLRHELPAMLAQGSGAIVNIASTFGIVGFGGAPAYVASKHGVIGLTRTAALEASRHGVRVNAVCPGFIVTPMTDRGRDVVGTEGYAQIQANHPIGRLGTPQEIAEAIVWLCSDAASFVTGAALLADGGYTAV